MASFDFTIRATDNLGAFADRTFSLEVRKTNIERFLVQASDGSMSTSKNGLSWPSTSVFPGAGSSPVTTDITGRTWNVMAYGNGVWLQAMGQGSSNRYMRSTNGITWDILALPLDRWNQTPLASITFNNGFFYIMSRNQVTTSSYSNATYYKSADGITWTFVNTGYSFGTGAVYLDMAHGANGVKMIWRRGSTVYILWDETNSTVITTGSFAANLSTPYRMKFFNGVWFATTGANYTLWTSVDGINWTQVTLPAATSPGWVACGDIMYGNGRLMVTLRRTQAASTSMTLADLNRVLVSSDGINWTAQPVAVNGAGTWTSAGTQDHHVVGAFTNGRFVIGQTDPAVPSGGNLYSTLNGSAWTNSGTIGVGASNNIRYIAGVDQANY